MVGQFPFPLAPIETVEELFSDVDARVIEWLYEREWHIPFLIRAFDSVQQYFGAGTRVFLEVSNDYETGEEQFWFKVNARQSVEEASKIEDKWWNEFWFEDLHDNMDICPSSHFASYDDEPKEEV